MNNQRKFLKCQICGNIVEVIKYSGVKIVCCGQEMTELAHNAVEGVGEKHIPVGIRDFKKLTVNVGSIPHPMTLEHHISWIVIAQGSSTQRAKLQKGDEPTATFIVGEGPIKMYAYCNLHGLWTADLP